MTTNTQAYREAFETHYSGHGWDFRTTLLGDYSSLETSLVFKGWQAAWQNRPAASTDVVERVYVAALQVLDDMDCVADYDEITDAPIWETNENKKTTNCCVAARDDLQAALAAMGGVEDFMQGEVAWCNQASPKHDAVALKYAQDQCHSLGLTADEVEVVVKQYCSSLEMRKAEPVKVSLEKAAVALDDLWVEGAEVTLKQSAKACAEAWGLSYVD